MVSQQLGKLLLTTINLFLVHSNNDLKQTLTATQLICVPVLASHKDKATTCSALKALLATARADSTPARLTQQQQSPKTRQRRHARGWASNTTSG